MGWIKALIHRWVGRDRYHTQASEVTARQLRTQLLSKQYEVYRRGK